MFTMLILAQRTSSPRHSKYLVVRNPCFVLLVWVCLLGHEFSVAAPADAAQHTAKSHPSSRAAHPLPVAAVVRPTSRTHEALRAFNHKWSVEAGAGPSAPSYKSSKAVKELSLAGTKQSITEHTGSSAVKPAAARLIKRSSTASGELPAAGAAQPIARRKTGSRSVKKVAGRRTARSKTGFRAVDKLSTAAVQTTPETTAWSNSDSREAVHHDIASGIPTIGQLAPSKTTAAWELPKGPIKKVLVIFEDVSVQPYEFWDRSPSCQECTGLPEKRKIVMDAIARQYAVLIPHPWDIHGMWEASPEMRKKYSPTSLNILNIMYSLAEWKSETGVQDDIPTVALGVSSGGVILSALALFPGYFESIGLMVSPGLDEAFESCTRDYPPSIFIHMPKDTSTAQKVFYDRKLLSGTGVPTKEVRWNEHSVTQYWFAELIPGLDQETSSEIHRHLTEQHWLDSHTGFLTPDSNFQNEWFEKVREWNLFPTNLPEEEQQRIEDRVFEELNVAYAYRATLARSNNELFAWFEGGYEVQGRIVHSPPESASRSISNALSNLPPPVAVAKPATVSLLVQGRNVHSQPESASGSISKAGSHSPPPVALAKPATDSLFKEASYKPATASLFKAASY